MYHVSYMFTNVCVYKCKLIDTVHHLVTSYLVNYSNIYAVFPQ